MSNFISPEVKGSGVLSTSKPTGIVIVTSVTVPCGPSAFIWPIVADLVALLGELESVITIVSSVARSSVSGYVYIIAMICILLTY